MWSEKPSEYSDLEANKDGDLLCGTNNNMDSWSVFHN
jgi:hypothetical protein